MCKQFRKLFTYAADHKQQDHPLEYFLFLEHKSNNSRYNSTKVINIFRETFGVIICIMWIKMTSHVSRTQFRSGHVLPAPRRLVLTSLYLSIVPLLLALICILRCQTNTNSCLAVIGLWFTWDVLYEWRYIFLRNWRKYTWNHLLTV